MNDGGNQEQNYDGQTGAPQRNYNGQTGQPEADTPTQVIRAQPRAQFGAPRTDNPDQYVRHGDGGEETQPVRAVTDTQATRPVAVPDQPTQPLPVQAKDQSMRESDTRPQMVVPPRLTLPQKPPQRNK